MGQKGPEVRFLRSLYVFLLIIVTRNIISGHNERLGIRTGANAAASTAIRYWIDLEGFVLYKGLQSLLKASRESGFKLENSFDGEDFFILFFLSWKLWGADLCSVVTFTPQILRALLRIGRWNPLEELHSAARALQIQVCNTGSTLVRVLISPFQTAVSLARQCLISWPLQSFLAIRRGIRDFSSSPFKTALLRLLRPRVAPDTTRITWFCVSFVFHYMHFTAQRCLTLNIHSHAAKKNCMETLVTDGWTR